VISACLGSTAQQLLCRIWPSDHCLVCLSSSLFAVLRSLSRHTIYALPNRPQTREMYDRRDCTAHIMRDGASPDSLSPPRGIRSQTLHSSVLRASVHFESYSRRLALISNNKVKRDNASKLAIYAAGKMAALASATKPQITHEFLEAFQRYVSTTFSPNELSLIF
jgi:hypothetical protein